MIPANAPLLAKGAPFPKFSGKGAPTQRTSQGGHKVVSPPAHEVLPIAATGQREPFLQHQGRHERRDDLLRDVQGLGAERDRKWTVDTGRMTMTFYDKVGREMLVEQIV